LVPAAAAIAVKRYQAVGYVQAMHELCIGCHARAAKAQAKPALARCATCHSERRSFVDARDLVPRGQIGARVVLPRMSTR
jgi:hypothetical protein